MTTSSPINSVCVYCGSSPGNDPIFSAEATKLGKLLAEHNIQLVYGGASIGVMGALANAVMKHGGKVTGIIPHGLFKREVAHQGITSLLVVDSMHERKALMAQMADALITLPGGFGTLEELFEMVTWNQIGIHNKPIYMLNTMGFYTPLLSFIEHTVKSGFIKDGQQQLISVTKTPEELMHLLTSGTAGVQTPQEVRP
ncbi:MAG: TIGR00730 family Rossman fold protein [Balneolales bacterium]|nr:TIGR00730 family Rossman fold protein [Balneolales bacterium]